MGAAMPERDSDLSGLVIEKSAARKALGMGREAFDAALRQGDIPSIKIGSRMKVHGAKFREMFGIRDGKSNLGDEVREAVRNLRFTIADHPDNRTAA